jgi:nucleoid-associated protein YgaU
MQGGITVTKEAKMGLLIGLVFIVAIAVVLRGVHQSTEQGWEEQLSINGDIVTHEEAGGSEELNLPEVVRQFETKTGRESQETPLAARQGEQRYGEGAGGAIYPSNPGSGALVEVGPGPVANLAQRDQANIVSNSANTRYVGDLPGGSLTGDIVFQPEDGRVERAINSITETPRSVDTVIAVVGAPQLQARNRTYVVQDGDDLSKISMKMYGEKEGNRWVNVKKIYETNSKILPSMDELQVGQKLVIPELAGIVGRSRGREIPPPSGLGGATQTGVVGRPRGLEIPPPSRLGGATQPQVEKIYVVKDGDSLWSIAEEKLGNGTRYQEIAKLNKSNLRSEDDIFVGMRLRVPGR